MSTAWRALRAWWRERRRSDRAEAALDAHMPLEPSTPELPGVTELAADELDLHAFLPREAADVVAEYVRWAAAEGKRSVRIIHGKGTGTLRRIVHAVLARHPNVERFGLAGERSGSWGATEVVLRPASPPRASERRAALIDARRPLLAAPRWLVPANAVSWRRRGLP